MAVAAAAASSSLQTKRVGQHDAVPNKLWWIGAGLISGQLAGGRTPIKKGRVGGPMLQSIQAGPETVLSKTVNLLLVLDFVYNYEEFGNIRIGWTEVKSN